MAGYEKRQYKGFNMKIFTWYFFCVKNIHFLITKNRISGFIQY